MKNQFKRYFIVIFILISIMLTSVVVFNFINDEFCAFGKVSQKDIDRLVFYPNERMLKINHILKHPDIFDSFIMGSSKAKMMSLRNVKNGNWYNATFAMNNLDETLSLLNILKNGGVKINNVLLQMSDENFREVQTSYSDYFDKEMIYARYPVTFREKLHLYTWYLLVLPDFRQNKRDRYEQSCKDNVLIDGACTSPPGDNHIVEKTKLTKNPPNIENYPPYNDYWKIPFKNIQNFCKENNIKLTVFITPETYTLYQKYDRKGVLKSRKDLAKLTSYYDFSGQNEITENHDYFYDHVHMNEYTQVLIIDRLFYQNPDQPPKIPKFGIYVKKQE